VYVIAKGKDHKQYEYGNKVSIATPQKTLGILQKISPVFAKTKK
jgi:hypothetical protein